MKFIHKVKICQRFWKTQLLIQKGRMMLLNKLWQKHENDIKRQWNHQEVIVAPIRVRYRLLQNILSEKWFIHYSNTKRLKFKCLKEHFLNHYSRHHSWTNTQNKIPPTTFMLLSMVSEVNTISNSQYLKI